MYMKCFFGSLAQRMYLSLFDKSKANEKLSISVSLVNFGFHLIAKFLFSGVSILSYALVWYFYKESEPVKFKQSPEMCFTSTETISTNV